MRRILLIEDNEADAILFERSLRRQQPDFSFEMCVVQTLSAAMDRAHLEVFDVVFLDMSLPDGQGAAMVETLRASGMDSPLWVLSGLEDPTVREAALAGGASGYLVKGAVDYGALLEDIP